MSKYNKIVYKYKKDKKMHINVYTLETLDAFFKEGVNN